MPSNIAALRKRVEQATGPDREIDFDLEKAFPTSRIDDDWFVGRISVERYTASIDAAVALAGRVRPFLRMVLDTRGSQRSEYGFSHTARFAYAGGTEALSGQHVTPALAVLEALLAAIEAREASR